MYITCALIELCKTRWQVSRETFLSRHLFQTTGNLTKSFRPTGSRVSHHSYVITHVTIVFSKCNTCVNRSFTSRNRHVGCVCNQHSTVSQQSICSWVNQLSKLFKYLSHLVTTLTTTNINNNVSITPFCKLVLCHCFTGTESARNTSSTTFGDWE